MQVKDSTVARRARIGGGSILWMYLVFGSAIIEYSEMLMFGQNISVYTNFLVRFNIKTQAALVI